jgi:PKD repeat protein
MRFVPSLERPSRGAPGPRRRRRGSAGQSLVELALVAPVLLLIVLAGIDFGRVYLGYINLQQMARIAANYAADNAKAWDLTPDADKQDRYQEIIENDSRAINCDLPRDGSGDLNVPGPVFANGFDLGDPVEVRLTCQFQIVTPIIGQILGGAVEVGAGAVFPVKEGAVASVPGGGGGTIAPPVADFISSPTSGYGPLEVTFVDASLNGPTNWSWHFGDGGTASTKGPHVRTYTCAGAPGTVCTFFAQLTVGNSGGFNTSSSHEITVTVPPDSGPVAEFAADDTTGVAPHTVDFEFVEITTGVTYVQWEWDFDGDGTFDDTGETVTKTYSAIGSYDVTLRVTDDLGNTNSQTKSDYIVVGRKICTVPDFFNVKVNKAQERWEAAGFSTTVTTQAGQGNYNIGKQTLLGGLIDPQPDGCDSTITVGP